MAFYCLSVIRINPQAYSLARCPSIDLQMTHVLLIRDHHHPFFFLLLPHYKPYLQVKGTSLQCYRTHGCVSPELPLRFVYLMRYWCCADNKVMAKVVRWYLQLIWSISLLSAPFVHSLLFFNLGGKDKSAEWHGEAAQNDVFSRKLKSIAICGGFGEAFLKKAKQKRTSAALMNDFGAWKLDVLYFWHTGLSPRPAGTLLPSFVAGLVQTNHSSVPVCPFTIKPRERFFTPELLFGQSLQDFYFISNHF